MKLIISSMGSVHDIQNLAKTLDLHISLLFTQSSGLEGYCRHGAGRRATAILADISLTA